MQKPSWSTDCCAVRCNGSDPTTSTYLRQSSVFIRSRSAKADRAQQIHFATRRYDLGKTNCASALSKSSRQRTSPPSSITINGDIARPPRTIRSRMASLYGTPYQSRAIPNVPGFRSLPVCRFLSCCFLVLIFFLFSLRSPVYYPSSVTSDIQFHIAIILLCSHSISPLQQPTHLSPDFLSVHESDLPIEPVKPPKLAALVTLSECRFPFMPIFYMRHSIPFPRTTVKLQ